MCALNVRLSKCAECVCLGDCLDEAFHIDVVEQPPHGGPLPRKTIPRRLQVRHKDVVMT